MQSFISGGGAYLYVDMSELQKTIDLLRGFMKPAAFERLLYRTFKEVGNKSKTIISKEVPKDYDVTRAWVRSQIGKYSLSIGGITGVTCSIPISGHKGSIGGRFKASGGRYGVPVVSWIKRYGMTYLPTIMKNQGGNPPFMGQGKINGVVFTRRTKERLPIVRVVGLGVPQMPLNLSSDRVQDEILDYAWNRLEHNFNHMLESGQLT